MNENNSPVFQSSKHESTTERYKLISTKELKERLESRGFEMTNAVVTKSKKYNGFQKHMLRFSHPHLSELAGITSKGLTPELVVVNSHMGSTSLKMMLGVFRTICSNGLIVASNLYDTLSIRHTGTPWFHIEDGLNGLEVAVKELPKRLEVFSGRILNQDERETFALTIANARLSNVSDVVKIDMDSILAPQRIEDKGRDLFTVLNVVQERVINGGIIGEQRVQDDNGNSSIVPFRTRKIRGVSPQVHLNQLVWSEAEKLAA